MALSTRAQIIAVLVLITAVTSDTLQPDPRVDGSNSKFNKLQQYESEKRISYTDSSNDIEDDRIQLPEPYKSLFQTTARFALVQTKISKHVGIETAMSLINDAGYILSKPSNLCKAVKIIAVSIATLVASTFLFPGAYRTIDALWHDPINTLNLDKYLANEKTVLGIVSSRVDEVLGKVGLYEVSCREKTICHAGEIIRNTFPAEAEIITKFASDHFMIQSFKSNRYFDAFSHGFVDRNCSAIASALNQGPESQNCLGNLLNSLVLSHWSVDFQPVAQQPRNKYQNIKVARA